MVKDQNTQTGSVSGSEEKIDINVLAKELGTSEDFLRGRLTGEETEREALIKLGKSAQNATTLADQLKGEKSSLIRERDGFRELAEKSLKQNPELPADKKADTSSKDVLTPEEEKQMEEMLELINNAKAIKGEQESLKKTLASLRGEVDITKNYAFEQSAQIRAQRLREGKEWLKRTFNEERANELLNEDDPGKSPLGRVFEPSLCTNKDERAFAELVANLAWKFENPVEMAYRILAERKELGSAFSKEISETEGAGRSRQGGELTKEEALKKEFFGMFE